MNTYSFLAVAVLLVADAATAAAPPPEQQQAQQEKKICRTEKMTGSLTRRSRICLTRAEWNELRARTRRGVDEMQNSASGGKECVMDQSGGCQVGGFPPAPANPGF